VPNKSILRAKRPAADRFLSYDWPGNLRELPRVPLRGRDHRRRWSPEASLGI